MVDFSTDEIEKEREIDGKTHEITEHFRHAESLLQQFNKQVGDSTISGAEAAVRSNIQKSIAKRLQSLSMSFRSSQKVNNSAALSLY